MGDQQSLDGIGQVGGKTWSVVGHVALVGVGEVDDEGTEGYSQ